jgi:hypothetical protein
MLEKLTGRPFVPQPAPPPPPTRSRKNPKRRTSAAPVPDYLKDPLKMAFEVRSRFPLGTKVYYSGKGYPINSPGTVIAYERSGFCLLVDFEWFAISKVTPCSELGWHLAKKPIPQRQAEKLYPKGRAGR